MIWHNSDDDIIWSWIIENLIFRTLFFDFLFHSLIYTSITSKVLQLEESTWYTNTMTNKLIEVSWNTMGTFFWHMNQYSISLLLCCYKNVVCVISPNLDQDRLQIFPPPPSDSKSGYPQIGAAFFYVFPSVVFGADVQKIWTQSDYVYYGKIIVIPTLTGDRIFP